ncbi:MAG: hypothetical protein A3G33_08495 [Omnitrophica bacterium RIFCSPLOWO2_12_FULL_44_17]|uniref:Uncharacterized protein n=1 Tax=Candidatus Danuiimicrobium aquiferis TaxID=1801832 RepID=A0A1G1KW48_9BACT|nr:MAG: hypothetical protein A3B72_03715 [Omnitrophica bacterium RIFCSPHIGHO2_02_FULL_45_28]OGW97204.1 MAG: hypothetical protein A3G33_08495 [Omnitrophica bacterium RIFCSPLOWO2_12_FULL_44_17]
MACLKPVERKVFLMMECQNGVVMRNGLKMPYRILCDIRSTIFYLWGILDSSNKIEEREKVAIVEITYHLCRNVLILTSDGTFIHAFRASLAVQQFLLEPTRLNRLSAKEHLLAIRESFALNQVCTEEYRKILSDNVHFPVTGGAQ